MTFFRKILEEVLVTQAEFRKILEEVLVTEMTLLCSLGQHQLGGGICTDT